MSVKQPRALRPWTKKAVEILSDGQWHDRDEVLAKCTPLVPEEHAVSRYRFYHTSVNEKNIAQRIGQARRYVAGHAMRNMENAGSIEYDQSEQRYRALWV